MATEIEIQLTGNLGAHEWDCIDLFKLRAEKLSQTEYSSGRYPIRGNLNYTQEAGMQYTCSIPPDSITVEHLTAYRHFFSKKEKCYFPAILKLIARYADNDRSEMALKKLRERWEFDLFKDAMRLSLNEENITASKLLDIWFNGEYFHSDIQKIEELEAMREAFPNDFFKFMLLDVVTTGTNQILMISDSMREIERDDRVT